QFRYRVWYRLPAHGLQPEETGLLQTLVHPPRAVLLPVGSGAPAWHLPICVPAEVCALLQSAVERRVPDRARRGCFHQHAAHPSRPRHDRDPAARAGASLPARAARDRVRVAGRCGTPREHLLRVPRRNDAIHARLRAAAALVGAPGVGVLEHWSRTTGRAVLARAIRLGCRTGRQCAFQSRDHTDAVRRHWKLLMDPASESQGRIIIRSILGSLLDQSRCSLAVTWVTCRPRSSRTEPKSH